MGRLLAKEKVLELKNIVRVDVARRKFVTKADQGTSTRI